MINGQRVTAIIPARNEVLAIPYVIKSLQDIKCGSEKMIDDILVVDNASTDHTARISEALGATVITETISGYGAACLKGIQEISETNIVVFVDGDFTYQSSDIKHVITSLVDYDIDLVMGSRFLGQIKRNSMTRSQIMGTQLICRIINWRYHYHFSDLGPLRAIRYDKLMQLNLNDRRFGWTAEMQIKAINHRLLMLEVPVTSHPRIGKSKISGTLKGSLLAAYDLLKIAFFDKVE